MTSPGVLYERIEWHPSPNVPGGGPLGRNLHHDDRSRGFAAMAAPAQLLRTTKHKRLVGIYNQGVPTKVGGYSYPWGTGSCTGQSLAGAMSSKPFGHLYRALSTALGFYRRATEIDPYEGTFVPDDTGSSGLAVAKVAQERGLISRYEHAFNLQAALTALLAAPILIGVNWYDSFDKPGADGLVRISPNAQVRGGHEMVINQLLLLVSGNYTGKDRLRIPQSWGYEFGDDGWIEMEIDTFARLLAEDGDATILIP